MNNYDNFLQLHHQKELFLLGNAWNVQSARILQQNGCKAIGTSSAAIANMLGYEDGENIPFDELLFVIKRILSAVNIPVSADIESGYSNDANKVVENIERLTDIGVVGINLEDSNKKNGKIELTDAGAFAKKINQIKNSLEKKNVKLFLNARTDAFLLKMPNSLEITLQRIKMYESAGADGIFVPFIIDPKEIAAVTSSSLLPLNVLSMPGLSSFTALSALGVKRVSMGSSFFRAVYKHADALTKQVFQQQAVAPFFV